MTRPAIQQFIRLTEFLGKVLGPDYEVVLHDIQTPDQSIVAIANGHISGRTIGAPLTQRARQILEEQDVDEEHLINYSGIAIENDTMLRSSSFFIKNDSGVPVGMLCINFNDKRYRDLSDRLLKLRHPDAFVETHFVYNEEKARSENVYPPDAESFHGSVSSVIEAAIAQAEKDHGVTANRLTADEKMAVVLDLDKKGIFLLKNAVKLVAKALHCSRATVYRYITRLNQEDTSPLP